MEGKDPHFENITYLPLISIHVPGTVPSALQATALVSLNPGRALPPILHTGSQQMRGIKTLAQDHTATPLKGERSQI